VPAFAPSDTVFMAHAAALARARASGTCCTPRATLAASLIVCLLVVLGAAEVMGLKELNPVGVLAATEAHEKMSAGAMLQG
jgi:hypothetical protein